MALFARAGRRLGKLNATNVGLWRASGAGIHLACRQNGDEFDYTPPPGYEKIFLKKKDMPELIDKSKPLTPRQRAEIASKYNMRPEDYEPMENYGDYPKLPDETPYDRDPYYDWDQPSLRRNHGEPLHIHQEVYDSFSALDRKPELLDRTHYTRFFMVFLATFTVLYLLGKRFPRFTAVAPIQLPEEFPADDRHLTNCAPSGEFLCHRSKKVVNYDFN